MTTPGTVAELAQLERTITEQQDAGRWREAQASSGVALRLAEELEDLVAAETQRLNIGASLAFSGETSAALPWLNDAVVRLERIDRTSSVVCLALSVALIQTGQNARAIPVLEAALIHAEIEGRWGNALQARVLLTEQLMRESRLSDAVEPVRRGLLQAELIGDLGAWTDLKHKYQHLMSNGLVHETYQQQLPHDFLRAAEAALGLSMDLVGAGDPGSARWVIENFSVRLTGPHKLPLVLRGQVEALLVDALARTGAYSAAIKVTEASLACLPDRRGVLGRVEKRRVQLLCQLAQIWSAMGNDAKAAEIAAEARTLIPRVREQRERYWLRLKLAKSLDGQRSAEECLQLARELEPMPDLLDIRCEALVMAALATEDSPARLKILDDVDPLLTDLSHAYRNGLTRSYGMLGHSGAKANLRENPDYFEPAVNSLRELSQTGRITALLATDPVEAQRLARTLHEHPSVVGGAVDVARMLTEFATNGPRVVDLARAAGSTLAAQIEGAASLGQRGTFFKQVQEPWAIAVSTLASAGNEADLALVFELADCAGRGSLRAFQNRGLRASSVLGLSDQGSASSRIQSAGTHLGSSAERRTVDYSRLRNRIAISYSVLVHEPGESLSALCLVANLEGPLSARLFTLSGRELELVENTQLWLAGIRATDSDWESLSAAVIGPAWEHISHLSLESPGELVISSSSDLLAALPWGALRAGPGVLAELATIQLTPAISVLSGEDPTDLPGDALVYCVASTDGETDLDVSSELAAFDRQRRWNVKHARFADDLLEGLAQPGGFAVAYIASHGEGGGEDSRLLHGDGRSLGVDDALQLWWPATVIMASCRSTRTSIRPGQDPLGLPLAVLLRGAQYVVGCNEYIEQRGGSAIGAAIIELLSRGHHPAAAVRQAQIDWIRSKGGLERAGLFAWAPFNVVSFQ